MKQVPRVVYSFDKSHSRTQDELGRNCSEKITHRTFSVLPLALDATTSICHLQKPAIQLVLELYRLSQAPVHLGVLSAVSQLHPCYNPSSSPELLFLPHVQRSNHLLGPWRELLLPICLHYYVDQGQRVNHPCTLLLVAETRYDSMIQEHRIQSKPGLFGTLPR